MKLTRPQMLVLIGIVTVVIAIVTNVATNQIPERLKPYLWLSWPLLGLLIIVLVVLTHRTSKEPGPPPPPELNLKGYYDALTKRYRTLDLDALTPPQREEYLQLQLRAVFVEQSVRENPPPIELPKEIMEKLQSEGELNLQDLPEGVSVEDLRASGDRYYSTPSTPVIDVLTEAENRQTTILGDPGAGKSTLARYIMLSLIDPDGDERLRGAFPNYLPILIELRTFNALREERKCDTFLQFLEYLGTTEGWFLTQAALDERLKKAGTVVIFDGLDEVFDPGDRERISLTIVGFSNMYSKARIIVTSRIVGYQRRVLADAGFAHYTLQDLNRSQVESFIGRWYDLALSDRPDDAARRKLRILQSFDQSASVRQLAGNPMLLTIMAIIGKHQELPRERWKLYDHAVSVLIEHWDVKRHLDNLNIDAPFIGEEDKKELLRRLAFRMQAGRAGLKGNYIHRDQLQEEFQDYLRTRFTLAPDRATTISRIMIDQFRQRNFILSLYGATVYGFVHRAFLEYFCATAFTYKFEKARDITIDQLAVDVFKAHWRDESWHEVLRLICGMLDERFAGQLVGQLLKLHDPEQQIGDVPPPNVELAVRCLSEIRNLNPLSDVTTLALQSVLEIFANLAAGAISVQTNQFFEKVSDTLKVIAPNWPNKANLAQLMKQFRPGEWTWIWWSEFSEFILAIGRGMEEVRKELTAYAGSNNENLRCMWPDTLAKGWAEDPETMPLLKEQISNDPSWKCRNVAIRALVQNYKLTPEIVRFMQERLENERSGNLRALIIRYVADVERPELISLITKQLSNEDSQARHAALMALRRHMNDEAVFTAILKQASEETSWVRMSFYGELAKHHKDDSRVKNLLLDRAANADDEETRLEIVKVLAETYPDDPQAQEIVRNSHPAL